MQDWSLKSRLSTGFGIMLILVLALSVTAWAQVSSMWRSFDSVAANVLPSVQTLGEMSNALQERRRMELRHFIVRDAAAKADSEAVIAQSQARFQAAHDHYLKDLVADEKDRQLAQEIGNAVARYLDVITPQLAQSRANPGNAELMATMLPQSKAKIDAALRAVDDALTYNKKLAEEAVALGGAAHSRAIWLTAGIALASLLIGIGMTVLVSRSILVQVGGEPALAVAAARRIASGDLTGDVPVHDGDRGSLLASMRSMQESLRGIVKEVSSGVLDLSSSVSQLDSGTREMSQASGQQSEATASMAAAIEQLSVGMSQLADSSQQANSVAVQSSQALNEGARAIEHSVDAMRVLSSNVATTADNVRTLGERSKEISTIVGVITAIAEQTNLLALNAAIEAARAGEQGRGFAVVADEVRKLAERTGQSTQQITEMVNAIVQGTQAAVASMHTSSEGVNGGLEAGAKALASMERMREGTETILGALRDVSHALDEQRSASQQIAANVERVAAMTEENTEAMHGLAGSAGKLSGLAARLRPSVERFRL